MVTQATQKIVDRLVGDGWKIDNADQFHGEPGQTFFLSKKIGRWSTTRYAEVDCQGNVNGLSYEAWLVTQRAVY